MRRDGYGGAEPYHWPVIVRGNAESSCAIRTILDSTPSIHLIETKPARPSRPTGLVLSLKRLPASAQELQLIEEFRCAGGRVLCTAPGGSYWSLGERCRLLLAGAEELFDESSDDYDRSLRSVVEEIVREEGAHFGELQRIRALMNDAGIAGVSSALTDVFKTVERGAPFSDLPLLITGETGTGKELFAKAVHSLDPRRRSAPFVAVNCGSLPDSLSESEMFGFRRGAFTGADRDRPGLFRSAHPGILFLDEIGELSLGAQTKFLRVLQTGRVLPVGEDRETEVDVRVIAATNRDLEEMVRKGQFREDLYHRINVLRIALPSLRERPEDIEPIAEHFVHKYRHLSNGAPVRLSRDFVSALQGSALPGNVRQLENLIRGALLSAAGKRALSLRDLPRNLLSELATETEGVPPPSVVSLRDIARQCLEQSGWNLTRAMELFERELLKTALDATQGNQSEAARKLGITPRSVYNKLHREWVARPSSSPKAKSAETSN